MLAPKADPKRHAVDRWHDPSTTSENGPKLSERP